MRTVKFLFFFYGDLLYCSTVCVLFLLQTHLSEQFSQPSVQLILFSLKKKKWGGKYRGKKTFPEIVYTMLKHNEWRSHRCHAGIKIHQLHKQREIFCLPLICELKDKIRHHYPQWIFCLPGWTTLFSMLLMILCFSNKHLILCI